MRVSRSASVASPRCSSMQHKQFGQSNLVFIKGRKVVYLPQYNVVETSERFPEAVQRFDVVILSDLDSCGVGKRRRIIKCYFIFMSDV